MDQDRFDADFTAAFRLSWPGPEVTAAPIPHARPAVASRGLRRLFRRFRRPVMSCFGWPVRLTAPSGNDSAPQPRVKLTGAPLD